MSVWDHNLEEEARYKANDVLLAIKAMLSEQHAKTMDMFRRLDVSGDGEISAEEFFGALAVLGLQPSPLESEAIMAKLDLDGSGLISLDEFERAVKGAKSLRRKESVDSTAERAARRFQLLEDLRLKQIATGKERAEDGARGSSAPTGEDIARLDHADEVLLKIKSTLDARKERMINVFRILDTSGDGSMSLDEFHVGLEALGLLPADEADFTAMVARLDQDCSGDVSLKEFDRALKQVAKKAKAEGRLRNTSLWGSRSREFDRCVDWSQRSISTAHGSDFGRDLGNSTRSFATTGSRAMTPRFTWRPAAAGPLSTALSSTVHSGSVLDASISRARPLDGHMMPGSRPPLLSTEDQMGFRPGTTGYRRPIMVERFNARPGWTPDIKMARTKRTCVEADRSYFELRPHHHGGTKTFPGAPTMKSALNAIVFPDGKECSGDAALFDKDFVAMFEGMVGLPSWHQRKR